MRITQRYEGEWVQPIRKDFRMQCCKCGLIHYWDFRIKERHIQIRAKLKKGKPKSIIGEKLLISK